MATVRLRDLRTLSRNDQVGKTNISLDIDWASDFVIEDCLNFFSSHDIYPTIFITHQSPLIDEIIKSDKHEIGLHPNFEKLLVGDTSNGENRSEVLNKLLTIYKEPKAIRSHSLTSSSRIKKLFVDSGIKIESNILMHGIEDTPLPWKDCFGILQVPITWEDDIFFTYDVPENISRDCIRPDIFNAITFHPIHIYLNTPDADTYDGSRPYQNNQSQLSKFKSNAYGVRDKAKEAIEAIYNGK